MKNQMVQGLAPDQGRGSLTMNPNLYQQGIAVNHQPVTINHIQDYPQDRINRPANNIENNNRERTCGSLSVTTNYNSNSHHQVRTGYAGESDYGSRRLEGANQNIDLLAYQQPEPQLPSKLSSEQTLEQCLIDSIAAMDATSPTTAANTHPQTKKSYKSPYAFTGPAQTDHLVKLGLYRFVVDNLTPDGPGPFKIDLFDSAPSYNLEYMMKIAMQKSGTNEKVNKGEHAGSVIQQEILDQYKPHTVFNAEIKLDLGPNITITGECTLSTRQYPETWPGPQRDTYGVAIKPSRIPQYKTGIWRFSVILSIRLEGSERNRAYEVLVAQRLENKDGTLTSPPPTWLDIVNGARRLVSTWSHELMCSALSSLVEPGRISTDEPSNKNIYVPNGQSASKLPVNTSANTTIVIEKRGHLQSLQSNIETQNSPIVRPKITSMHMGKQQQATQQENITPKRQLPANECDSGAEFDWNSPEQIALRGGTFQGSSLTPEQQASNSKDKNNSSPQTHVEVGCLDFHSPKSRVDTPVLSDASSPSQGNSPSGPDTPPVMRPPPPTRNWPTLNSSANEDSGNKKAESNVNPQNRPTEPAREHNTPVPQLSSEKHRRSIEQTDQPAKRQKYTNATGTNTVADSSLSRIPHGSLGQMRPNVMPYGYQQPQQMYAGMRGINFPVTNTAGQPHYNTFQQPQVPSHSDSRFLVPASRVIPSDVVGHPIRRQMSAQEEYALANAMLARSNVQMGHRQRLVQTPQTQLSSNYDVTGSQHRPVSTNPVWAPAQLPMAIPVQQQRQQSSQHGRNNSQSNYMDQKEIMGYPGQRQTMPVHNIQACAQYARSQTHQGPYQQPPIAPQTDGSTQYQHSFRAPVPPSNHPGQYYQPNSGPASYYAPELTTNPIIFADTRIVGPGKYPQGERYQAFLEIDQANAKFCSGVRTRPSEGHVPGDRPDPRVNTNVTMPSSIPFEREELALFGTTGATGTMTDFARNIEFKFDDLFNGVYPGRPLSVTYMMKVGEHLMRRLQRIYDDPISEKIVQTWVNAFFGYRDRIQKNAVPGVQSGNQASAFLYPAP